MLVSSNDAEESTMFSQHAITRMQQRGISGEAVELLLDYGRSSYHKGSEVVYLDRRSRSALLQSGALIHAQCDRIRNHYLVLGDGLVITVGHKYRHFKRDRH